VSRLKELTTPEETDIKTRREKHAIYFNKDKRNCNKGKRDTA
jgi:hypothetical protein